MHTDMVIQFLIPGVEYLNNAGYCAKVSGVGRKLQESLGAALVEKIVKKALALVAVQKWI